MQLINYNITVVWLYLLDLLVKWAGFDALAGESWKLPSMWLEMEKYTAIMWNELYSHSNSTHSGVKNKSYI